MKIHFNQKFIQNRWSLVVGFLIWYISFSYILILANLSFYSANARSVWTLSNVLFHSPSKLVKGKDILCRTDSL